MNAWTLALNNCIAPEGPPPPQYVSRGKCAYCGHPLPEERRKYCTAECMRTHHNLQRCTTRAGRKATTNPAQVAGERI